MILYGQKRLRPRFSIIPAGLCTEMCIRDRERDSIPLLASGPEIFWVAGHRISESCKIDNNTRHVLHIQITGGNTHE